MDRRGSNIDAVTRWREISDFQRHGALFRHGAGASVGYERPIGGRGDRAHRLHSYTDVQSTRDHYKLARSIDCLDSSLGRPGSLNDVDARSDTTNMSEPPSTQTKTYGRSRAHAQNIAVSLE